MNTSKANRSSAGLAAIFAAALTLGAAPPAAEPEASAEESRRAALTAPLDDAWAAEDMAAAAEALIAIADADPDLAREHEGDVVIYIVDQLERAGDDDRVLRLFTALAAADWSAPDSVFHPEWLKVELGRRLLARGEAETAAAALADVRTQYYAMDLRTNRRFETLWPTLAHADDIEAATQDWRDEVDAAAQGLPGYLEPILEQMSAHRAFGRPQEAAALGQAARRRLMFGGAPYLDQDDAAAKVMLSLADALYETGAAAQARVVLRQAITLPSDGRQPNMYVILEAAERLLDEGRFADAARTARRAPDDALWDYAQLKKAAILACAAAETGDRDAWAEKVQALRDGAGLFPIPYTRALLCGGALDEAADAYLAQMNDDRWGPALYTAFQSFDGRDRAPRYVRELLDRRDAALARPDVAARAEALFRSADWPLPVTYWGYW